MNFFKHRTIKIATAVLSVTALSGFGFWLFTPLGWQMFGQNKENTSYQENEHTIGVQNVADLKLKWVYNTDESAVAMGAVDIPLLGENVFEKSWVKATPAIDQKGEILYFPDMNGRLHAVNAKTGKPLWVKNIVRDYFYAKSTIPPEADIKKVKLVSQNTPVIYNDLIIIGLRALGDPVVFFQKLIAPPSFDSMITGGATLLAINRYNGNLVWRTDVSEYPTSKISASLSLYNGIIYGGVSVEAEETALHPLIDGGKTYNAITQAYQFKGIPMPNNEFKCCNAIGSVFAVDARTGNVKWSVPTIEKRPGLNRGFGGFAGVSMWGSAPAIDPKRNQIYVATSSALGAPPEVLSCLEAAEQIEDTNARFQARGECIPKGVNIDSIMALDMDTGHINWSNSYGGADFSDGTCYSTLFSSEDAMGNPTGIGWGPYFEKYGLGDRDDALAVCGDPRFVDSATGDDFLNRDSPYFNINFGQSPTLVKQKGRDILITGQKTSDMIALDPKTGAKVWITHAGVSSGIAGGGSMFGIATDGKLVYSTDGNPLGEENILVGESKPSAGGFFTATRVRDGKIIWQTRDPNASREAPFNGRARPYGNVTLANGVLYGTSIGNSLIAMNAKNGKILFEYRIDGAGYAPPAIYQGTLYWPTGYAGENFIFGTLAPDSDPSYTSTDNKVYAFEAPDKNHKKHKKH